MADGAAKLTQYLEVAKGEINRLDYIKMHAKILSATDKRLKKYLQFASEQMGTKITNDDVVEYALNLLFDRDGAFKNWSKSKA